MTAEEITRLSLVSDTAITDVVGDNIYVERVPQGFTAYPCLLIQYISERVHKGQTGDCVDEVTLQVSVIAKSYTVVSEVGRFIRANLDYKKGLFGTTKLMSCLYQSTGVDTDFDDGSLFTKSLDFSFLIQK